MTAAFLSVFIDVASGLTDIATTGESRSIIAVDNAPLHGFGFGLVLVFIHCALLRQKLFGRRIRLRVYTHIDTYVNFLSME